MNTLHNILTGTEYPLSTREQTTLVPTEPDSVAQSLSSEQRRCLLAEAYQWLKQGIAHYRQGQYTPALALLQQALQTYRSVSYSSGEGKVLLTLASLYYQLADYLWALDYARQSLSIATKVNDLHLTQQSLSYLGNSYRHLKDLNKALTYTQQSLQVAQAIPDRSAEMRSLNNLAMIYRLQNYHQQAAELYEASLLIAEELNNQLTVEQILRNLGNTYHALGNHPKTIHYYERLLDTAASSSHETAQWALDPRTMMRIFRTLTKACKAEGDHIRAIHYLNKRLRIVRQLHDVRSEEQILDQVAESYEILHQTGLALDCYEQRLQLLLKIGDKSLQRQAFNYFHCVCLSYGEGERALPYLHLFENQGSS